MGLFSSSKYLWKLIFLIFSAFAFQIKAQVTGKNKEDLQLFGDIFSQGSQSLLLMPHPFSPFKTRKCEREVPVIFFQTSKDKPVHGNGSTIFYHRIQVCCEGYVRSPHDWDKCVPDCSQISPNNCRNGFCRSPNQCECFDEFVRNDHGECVHTCPIECQYGRCYLNGTCICHTGYALDPQTRKFCRPECLQACANNQECVAPGKCDCKAGYRWTNEFGCQPICTPDCGYGKCVGPNECECFSGYTKRPQRNVCEAGCYVTCENGFCESHYKCQCHDGYKYDMQTTSCLPDCGEKCENGICINPGVCKCFEGYARQGNSCVPKCYGGCGYHGDCIDVNICACGNAEQRCLMGTCDRFGRCLCRSGLTHFIDRCVEPQTLRDLISTYQQREHLNQLLKEEFDGIIGNMFTFSL